MTLIVGIRCRDGVVLAADRAVTFVSKDRHTITHLACKISIPIEGVIVAGYNAAGLAQRFSEMVGVMWSRVSADERASPLSIGRMLCAKAIEDFNFTSAGPGKLGALVAFPHPRSGPQLCEFQISDFQPELMDEGTWFVSLGSGQGVADPYLALVREAFWHGGMPTLEHGLFAAAWVMRQSIKAAPIMIAEPIDIAVLEGNKARLLDANEQIALMAIADRATRYFGTFDPSAPANEVGNTEPLPGPSK